MDLSKLNEIKVKNTQRTTLKGIADIIFLIDTTGSMGEAIKNVVTNIGAFIESLDENIVKEWRVKVASFGDFEKDNEADKFNINREWVKKGDDLQKLADQFIECVEIVAKGGGGDKPESALDALYLTVTNGFDEDWSKRKRVVVLITDAPTKNISEQTISADIDRLQYLANKIKDNHVYVFLYSPKDEKFDKLAKLSSGNVIYNVINPQGEDAEESLRNVNFKKTLEIIGKTISTPDSFKA